MRSVVAVWWVAIGVLNGGQCLMVDMTYRLGNDTTIYPGVSRKMEMKVAHRGWFLPAFPNTWYVHLQYV